MNIAILADVHGRLLLAFKLIERYQRETGERIDLILQCGDVGIFPGKTDKATKTHAKRDVTELGYKTYFVEPLSEAQSVLDSLSCDMIVVRGNHEDHQFLDGLEAQCDSAVFPVDCYRRIWCMKTGVVHRVRMDETGFTLLGIGRAGAPAGEKDPYREKYIQRHEQERLASLADASFDILLTHDARRDFIRPGIGMREISTLLDRQKPAYHFFGHTGRPFERMTDPNGVTICSKLSDFEWDESLSGGPLKEGCLGVLRWRDRNDHSFEVIDARWIKEYTPNRWLYL